MELQTFLMVCEELLLESTNRTHTPPSTLSLSSSILLIA
uniref:Uncharacterized protein n=1 Tax=Setaria italica TaxID=4555 RepID=K3ZPH8_SETIT